MSRTLILCGFFLFAFAGAAQAREWSDATGKYTFEGDLVAHDDVTVVIKKKDGQLISTSLLSLSKSDRAFLAKQPTASSGNNAADGMQTWTFVRGQKAVGRVVAYGRRELSVQRRRGRIYANDRVVDNLPAVYQQMLLRIISHETGETIESNNDLQAWILKLKGAPATFTLEGVILELENGDEYGVPFFFFSEQDLAVLKPGWERWSQKDADEKQRQQENLHLQSLAIQNQQDRARQAQVTRMELGMLGVASGVFDLWEVALGPGAGMSGGPVSVVVPGRSSADAANAALQKYPGYVVGPIRMVSTLRR